MLAETAVDQNTVALRNKCHCNITLHTYLVLCDQQLLWHLSREILSPDGHHMLACRNRK